MGGEDDWVLGSAYIDRVLWRNKLAYDLFQSFGEGSERWAPEQVFCELTLDGEYRGVYLLGEPVRRDADRLDIADADGSFIVKLAEEGGFTDNLVGYGEWQAVYPKQTEANAPDLTGVDATLTAWQEALLAGESPSGTTSTSTALSTGSLSRSSSRTATPTTSPCTSGATRAPPCASRPGTSTSPSATPTPTAARPALSGATSPPTASPAPRVQDPPRRALGRAPRGPSHRRGNPLPHHGLRGDARRRNLPQLRPLAGRRDRLRLGRRGQLALPRGDVGGGAQSGDGVDSGADGVVGFVCGGVLRGVGLVSVTPGNTYQQMQSPRAHV